MFRSLLIAFIFLCSITAAAQKHFNLRIYSTENGLPSNGIKGMQWDNETGFLWIATEAGVVRFNGIDFKLFTSENTPQLKSDRISFMVRDHHNRILTAEGGQNIFEIRQNKISFYRQYPNIGKLSWIGVSEKMLEQQLQTSRQNNFFLPFDKLVNISDTACYIQQNGVVYYASLTQNKKIEFPEIRSVNRIFKIGENFFIKDDQDRFFELTKQNSLVPVHLISAEGEPFQLLKASNFLYWENGMDYPILFDNTDAWILKWNGKEMIAQNVADNIPPSNYIRFAQYCEKDRLLFIGTDSKGIMVIGENKVMPMKSANSGLNEKNAYYGQIELPGGNVLTNEGHIIGSNKNIASKIPLQPFIFSAFETGDSLLWYDAFVGPSKNTPLHRINKYTGSEKIYDKLAHDGDNAVALSNGRTYVARLDGFGYLTGDSIHYIFTKDQWQFTTSAMIEVESGILFLATCRGLLRFNTATEKLDTLFNKAGSCIRCIWKYNEYVFFGTYGNGFFIWKNGVTKAMPLDKNKYLLYTHCFIPDKNGFCWISTNRGLFKAKISDLTGAYEKPVDHVYYHYHGKNDGMETTEMNGGCVPCALALKTGILSFPTMDGLLWVDPLASFSSLPTGAIFIDDFLVNNKEVKTDSAASLKLPAKSSDITIKLGYTGWCNKENIYIEYRLNEDEAWKPLSDNEAVIHYTSLPSGDYTLQIRKLNGFGENNYTTRQLKFTIDTPWYRSWWFYTLACLTVFGIIYLLFQWRIRQHQLLQKKLERQVEEKTKELTQKNQALEKADNIKTRLISIISHDIVTPLKFVTVAGKNLIEKRRQMPEELQNEALQEIANTSQELQLLSTNILNWIKYQNENRRLVKEDFNVCDMVDSVFGVLRSIASQQGLQLMNDVDKELVVHQYYEPMKILVYNLITNAINFSDSGSITVSSAQQNGQVVLSIADQGSGMTEEQVQNILSNQVVISSANKDNRKGHGLGYLIIKDLIKLLDADIKIESQKGKGTTVKVVLKGNVG